MKQNRESVDAKEKEKNGFQSFADEYLTTKNVLIGLGVASIAGVATYSTVRVLKDEKMMNRIKKELNFDNIKNSITSTLGLEGEKKKEGRAPVKSRNSKKEAKPKAKKRYVTG